MFVFLLFFENLSKLSKKIGHVQAQVLNLNNLCFVFSPVSIISLVITVYFLALEFGNTTIEKSNGSISLILYFFARIFPKRFTLVLSNACLTKFVFLLQEFSGKIQDFFFEFFKIEKNFLKISKKKKQKEKKIRKREKNQKVQENNYDKLHNNTKKINKISKKSKKSKFE